VVDLEGRALLPGFIDAHSHLWLTGFQSKAANLLPEPDGTVRNIPMLQTKLREFSADPSAKKWNWIVGFGYDDSMLEPNRIHPTHRIWTRSPPRFLCSPSINPTISGRSTARA
jgi:predicted amidohydrolase YtcJ